MSNVTLKPLHVCVIRLLLPPPAPAAVAPSPYQQALFRLMQQEMQRGSGGSSGNGSGGLKGVNNVLMEMRNICNHPLIRWVPAASCMPACQPVSLPAWYMLVHASDEVMAQNLSSTPCVSRDAATQPVPNCPRLCSHRGALPAFAPGAAGCMPRAQRRCCPATTCRPRCGCAASWSCSTACWSSSGREATRCAAPQCKLLVWAWGHPEAQAGTRCSTCTQVH